MKPKKKAIEMTVEELARYIDHSVLKPEFTQNEIKKHIQDAINFKCRTVCINPSSLDIAKEMTNGTDTGICVVCDFPFGTSTTESKVLQAKVCCEKGVEELDIVSNFGWIKSGRWDKVKEDIEAVVNECHKYKTAVKVILETDALTEEEIKKATEVVISTGADFVKTSTGFLTGHENKGAAPEVIELIMGVTKGRCKIKGSGAIRTREHFLKLIDMGIDRMGIGYKSTPIVLGITQDNK
ncbi:deoxyribose-phosphate aldolase [Haloimpatiens massiliensis]|uniref:deoxyribose-phosphate aldolase n=1 Tax=Haloimpatiens massiliensis TaxID=1658110 RepID=UPI000C83AE33|nr:deoxyribose-phosphate aldolase [Haloimpatiens massiliensis]